MVPRTPTGQLAELYGILLGDGSLQTYYVRIYLNMRADKGYAQSIKKLITTIFPTTLVTITRRPLRGTEEVQVSSVLVSSYLTSVGFDPKNRAVPSWIYTNQAFSLLTVRGLFDTEGSLSIKKYHAKNGYRYYTQLTFTNKNPLIASFVRKTLESIGLKPTTTTRPNMYISNPVAIERYFKLVGTRNPKLEKKWKIVRMLIAHQHQKRRRA